MSLTEYVAEKLRLLKNDFKVKFTDEERAKLCSAKSEISVDNVAHDILKSRLFAAHF
jgi:hypothetical protein